MDATVSSLPHHYPLLPRRPPIPPLRPALLARRPSLPSSLLHLQRHHEGSRHDHPWPSVSPLRRSLPRRRGSHNAGAAGAVALWGRANGRRKRGRKAGGLDRATTARWASILLLAGSIRRFLTMQPLDVLAVLLEHGRGAGIGGGDDVVGMLKRGLSAGGHARRRNRAWRGALGLAIKAASAVAAAAAIWLLLFGKWLL